MSIDPYTIVDDRVRSFYVAYWPQRQILHDFFSLLTEEQFTSYRMVDMPQRKSDTPRESLAHILRVQLILFNGLQAGRIEFKAMDVEHYWQMSKSELVAEMERIDQAMFDYLTAAAFDSNATVQAPWGEVNGVDALAFLRDHDILHIGWNLALMDHLDLPRYETLSQYWGEGDEHSF